MYKKIFSAGIMMSMALLSACTSENVLVDEPALEQTGKFEYATEPLAVYLTDAEGNQVDNISGQFGIYNLHIEGAEAWVIDANDSFVYASQTMGRGNAVIPVQIGTCWGENRSAIIDVHTLDLNAPATRGGESTATTRLKVAQQTAVSASDIQRLGSNLGTGYAVNPTRSTNILFCMGQPIFDNTALLSDGTMHQDYSFVQEEDVTVAQSEKALMEKLSVAGGLAFKNGTIAIEGSGSYGSNYSSNTNSWYCRMTNRSTYYLRELYYLNEVNREGGARFSAGFKGFTQDMESQLAAATSVEEVKNIVNAFFDNFGPFFIYRSSLGAELDYTCTINKSVTSDSTMIAAAVKLKWEKEVVPQKDKKDDSGSGSSTGGNTGGNTGGDTGGNTSSTDDKADDVPEGEENNGGNTSGPDESSDDVPNEDVKAEAAIQAFFNQYCAHVTRADKKDDEKKDTTSVDVNAEVEYQKQLNEIANNTTARLEIHGGTPAISILSTGGTITPEELSAWQKNVDASNAVMLNYSAAPIYILFKSSSLCYKYLKQYDENAAIISLIN